MTITLGSMWVNPAYGVSPSQCICGGFGTDANGNIDFAAETGDGSTQISGTLYKPQTGITAASAAKYALDIQSQQASDPSAIDTLLTGLSVAIQHYAAAPGGEYSSSAPIDLSWATNALTDMENNNFTGKTNITA